LYEAFQLLAPSLKTSAASPVLANDQRPTTILASLLRTSIFPASGSRHLLHPAFRGSRDSARLASLSRDRRGSARSSAPASCGRRRECMSSLQSRWSNAPAPLFAMQNLASSESVCTLAYRRLAFADILEEPDWPSCTEAACAQLSPID